MRNKKWILVLVFTTLFITQSYCQLRLSSVFSDNGILQRDTVTQFWGWAKAGAKVKVKASWLPKAIETTTNGNGQWKIDLQTTKAGGPYSIQLESNSETITLNNLLMGEIWLCSGQSNMQWNAGNKLPQMLEALPHIANSNIRFLNVTNYASDYPQENILNNWEVCDSASAHRFSAIGYFFAKELVDKLDVPIGIINASWGGTCAEVWIDEEVIQGDAALLEDSKTKKIAPRKPNLPGRAYNSMIHPLVGFSIAGVLWYQGEDNVGTWSNYDRLFSTLITDWRKKWEQDYPFYFAQIAPYTYKNKDLPRAAYLREQQAKVAVKMPDVEMVVTSDLVDDVTNIHPIQKKEVAQRFAAIALNKKYNSTVANPLSPIYKSYSIKKSQIEVEFYNMENEKLTIEDKAGKLQNLYIAGADKRFLPAKYKIIGNKLIVFHDNIKNPVAVRYAFSEVDMTNLKSSNGLPVSLFRTDDWLQFTQ